MKRFQKFSKIDGPDLINSTLKSIELNITTVCNRSCSFCPHSWGFKSEDTRQKFMSLETIDRFIELIKDYKNNITLCGMGEPTLHPQIAEILDKLQVLNNKITLITNAYKLNEIKDHLGKIRPRISLYEPMELPDIEYDLIDYTKEGENEYFNNRSYGDGLNKPCYFPSYKLVIDTNGGILPCDNNWQNVLHLSNIHDNDLKIIWLEKLHPLRKNCLSNRLENDYCKNCDSHGTLYGKTEADLLTTNLP